MYGGRRLAGTRHHLGTARLTVDEWRTAWDEARFWFGCAGNKGALGGNPCLTMTRGAGGHWYLTVSVPKPVAEDTSGNPVGRPVRVPLDLADVSTKTPDGRLRAAMTAVLEYAKATAASAIAVEDLDFADSKDRERFGRRKAFRHLIAGFPTTQFRDRVVAMAHTRGLAVIAVDPRYTSRYGGASWQRALSGPSQLATRHEGASVAIGRRALGHGLTTRAGRKPAAGRSPQRPVPHQRDGSSDPRVQGRATTETTEAAPAAVVHQPPARERQPSRRPPRTSGVATPEGLSEQVDAGHRFPGDPPTR